MRAFGNLVNRGARIGDALGADFGPLAEFRDAFGEFLELALADELALIGAG